MVAAHRKSCYQPPARAGSSGVRKAPSVKPSALHLCSPRVCSVSKRSASQEIVLWSVLYIFFTISFLGSGSQAFCHQTRTVYGLFSRTCG